MKYKNTSKASTTFPLYFNKTVQLAENQSICCLSFAFLYHSTIVFPLILALRLFSLSAARATTCIFNRNI